MAKGGETTSKVELPPEIKDAALQNLSMAKDVAAIPYTPNFGLQMAAFTPDQNAAFANTNQAASAFGLPTAAAQTAPGAPNAGQTVSGVPKPTTVGGFSGYSTKPLYENAVAQIPAANKNMIEGFQKGLIAKSSFKEDGTKKKTNGKASTVDKNKMIWAPAGAPTSKKHYKEGGQYTFGGQQYFYKNGMLHRVTGGR